MDKKFVTKNKLDEAVRRFQQISSYKSPAQSLSQLNEYTFVTSSPIEEDDEQDDGELQQPQGGMGQPQNQPPMPQNQEGGMNGQMGGEMLQNGTEMPQDGSQMPQGDMQQPPMDGGMGMQDQGDGMEDQGGDMDMSDIDDENVETEEMEPDDEVIDVDELTQSQEATEYKIDGVDDRLSKIFSVVKDFSDKLDRQEQEIMSLKDEFTKRNPTPEERLNIRSQSSYPYSELPKDYWEEKAKENPNYNVIYDNEVSPSDEQDRFEIRKSDIDGLDMRTISDTLNMNPKLSDYIGF